MIGWVGVLAALWAAWVQDSIVLNHSIRFPPETPYFTLMNGTVPAIVDGKLPLHFSIALSCT
jgi:hypothetical protein